MIDNHSMDRFVKYVLMMVLMMHTEEEDTVLHIEKTGMLMLVVEIDVGGMTADVVDKLNYSSDDVQLRQVDLRSTHALTELYWHDTHVEPDRHEVDQLTIRLEHAISLYLEGLPTELEMSVRMFKPTTLAEAYSLTTLNNNRLAVLTLPALSSGLRPKPNTPVNAPLYSLVVLEDEEEEYFEVEEGDDE
nr:hypothetical protein [Tanacetum cinerariifolium]